METGSIVGSIDVAQVTLYVFWVFFAALIWYIRREDRREGYPLEHDITGEYDKDPWLWLPAKKTFNLPHGHGKVQFPDGERDTRPIAAERMANFAGAPLIPTGNPMIDGVGPAAWAERADIPEVAADGKNLIAPMSDTEDFSIAEGDPDPRGMEVIGCNDGVAGTISDVWVDRAEQVIRYFQVDLAAENGGRTVLLPHNFCTLGKKRGDERYIRVRSITAAQFADVPGLAAPGQVTLLEEDRIMGYYGGGTLYATPERQEPLL